MQEVQSAGGLGTHDPAAKGRHQETYKDRLPHKAHSLTPVCPNPFYFSNGPRGPGSWKEKPEPWGSRDREISTDLEPSRPSPKTPRGKLRTQKSL